MKIKGNAWCYGNDINTDFILPGRYLELTDPKEMAKHAMEGIDTNFTKKVKPGDIVVGIRNMGLGSSREHAPIALKHVGVGAVVAKTFARIFYRNAINVGLPALECIGISKKADEGDMISVDLRSGTVENQTTGTTLKASPLPQFILSLLEEGGLIPHVRGQIGKR